MKSLGGLINVPRRRERPPRLSRGGEGAQFHACCGEAGHDAVRAEPDHQKSGRADRRAPFEPNHAECHTNSGWRTAVPKSRPAPSSTIWTQTLLHLAKFPAIHVEVIIDYGLT